MHRALLFCLAAGIGLAAALFAGAARPAEPRLLITAFEPFGERDRNASREVLAAIRARHGNRFSYAVLPVSDDGERRLRALLADGRYDGVIALGEDVRLPGRTIHVEPYAVDAPLSKEIRPARPSERVPAPAAVAAARATGLPLVSGIGLYYCNRVYLHALRTERPAVFLHVPVHGDRATHVRQVLAVADALSGS